MLKRLYTWFFVNKDIRRYNFIYGTWLVYSAFYTRIGFFGFFSLKNDLDCMKVSLASKYNLYPKQIKVSATIKDK